MTQTLTKPKPSRPFDFDNYSDNLVRSAAIPWVQLITPKDRQRPFGLFLKKECAEGANFRPSPDWKPHTATFESGNTDFEEDGFLTQSLRLCVVQQSPLDGYGKNQWGKYEWLGPMYENGQLTSIGQRVREGGPDFYQATRYLLFFLDSQNQRLHDFPLQLKAKGAFGASFGVELREFQKALSKAFILAARLDGKNNFNGELNREALTLGIFQASLNLRRSDQGAVVCYLSERHHPVARPENFGRTKVEPRRAGADITLRATSWQDLFIPKDSDLGQHLLQAHRDHAGFGQRTQPEPFFGVGNIPNPEAVVQQLRFGEDGSVSISFPFNTVVGDQVLQYHCETYGETALWLADHIHRLAKAEVTGTRINGTVRVERIDGQILPPESSVPNTDDF